MFVCHDAAVSLDFTQLEYIMWLGIDVRNKNISRIEIDWGKINR